MVKATIIKTICSTDRKLGQWHRGVWNRHTLKQVIQDTENKRKRSVLPLHFLSTVASSTLSLSSLQMPGSSSQRTLKSTQPARISEPYTDDSVSLWIFYCCVQCGVRKPHLHLAAESADSLVYANGGTSSKLDSSSSIILINPILSYLEHLRHFSSFTFSLLWALVILIKTAMNGNNLQHLSKPPASCSVNPFHILLHEPIVLRFCFKHWNLLLKSFRRWSHPLGGDT